MCGIAGIVDFSSNQSVTPQRLTHMIEAAPYRGPDEMGLYLDDSAGLAHARLSIIDVAGGAQPIHNETRTMFITYNGEIYNYKELRSRLVALGHSFYTNSDTEVIVHLYEEYGTRALEYLNGQWAFALWDVSKKTLFMARDRLGVRPLHYAQHKSTFLFASEIKSLFASGLLVPSINVQSLDQVFTFWTTLPGRTLFKGIQELPAGHFLIYSQEGMHIQRYWEMPLYPRDAQISDSPKVIELNVRDLLVDSVRVRLEAADVPVGTYLSGGLDSSGVTAIVAKDFNPAVKTFGIRFEDAAFDEGLHQHKMVKSLGVDHTEIVATHQSIAASFGEVVKHCEKPLLRTSPVPLYMLSKKVASKGVKVVLTGEGADEICGGYDIFKEALVRQCIARAPHSTLRPKLLERLYPDIFRDDRSKKASSSFFMQGLDQHSDMFFSHMLRWNNAKKLKAFFSSEVTAALTQYNPLDEYRQSLPKSFASWHPLHKAQFLESDIFLSTYLLSSQGDRVAMAHSVEGRMPFLDHRLIDYMGRIPPFLKICGLNEKHILKKALAPYLPQSIVARTKHPYRAPIHASMKSLLATPEGERLLTANAVATSGLFDPERVGFLVKKLVHADQGSEVDTMALCAILSTQIIYHHFCASSLNPKESSRVPTVFIDHRSRV